MQLSHSQTDKPSINSLNLSNYIKYSEFELEEKIKKQYESCSVIDGRVDRLEEKQAVMEVQILTDHLKDCALDAGSLYLAPVNLSLVTGYKK